MLSMLYHCNECYQSLSSISQTVTFNLRVRCRHSSSLERLWLPGGVLHRWGSKALSYNNQCEVHRPRYQYVLYPPMHDELYLMVFPLSFNSRIPRGRPAATSRSRYYYHRTTPRPSPKPRSN